MKYGSEPADFLITNKSITARFTLAAAIGVFVAACSKGSERNELFAVDIDNAEQIVQHFSAMSLDAKFNDVYTSLIERSPATLVGQVADSIEIRGVTLSGLETRTKVLMDTPNFGVISGKKVSLRQLFEQGGSLEKKLNSSNLSVGLNMLRVIASAPAQKDAILTALSKFSTSEAIKGANALTFLDALIGRYGPPEGVKVSTAKSLDGKQVRLMLGGGGAAAGAEGAAAAVSGAFGLASKENANCGSANKTTDSSSKAYNTWQNCQTTHPELPHVCDQYNVDREFPGAGTCNQLGFKWKCEDKPIGTASGDTHNYSWEKTPYPEAPKVILHNCKNGTTTKT